MNSGEIVLTFPATCVGCRAPIPYGVRVWWDAGTGEISCVGQHVAAAPVAPAAPTAPVDPYATPARVYDQDRTPPVAAPAGAAPPASAPVPPTVAATPSTGRRWDPLAVDDPNWWDSFDQYTPTATSSNGTNGSHALAAHAEPRPATVVTALEPTPAPSDVPAPEHEPVVSADLVAPPAPRPVVEPTLPPVEPYVEPRIERIEPPQPARSPRRGFTTSLTPAGIAGLPAAHRRTRLPRPRTSWGPSSMLHLGLGRSVAVLDDRAIVGRHIDHVVVAQSGVWVITIKQSRGLVEKRAGGTLVHPRDRLLVDGRERTRALRSALITGGEITSIVNRMGDGWDKVPVRPVLCFVDAEWRPLAQPFEVDGVTVVWPKQLGALVNAHPLIASRSVDVLAAHLDAHLPPDR